MTPDIIQEAQNALNEAVAIAQVLQGRFVSYGGLLNKVRAEEAEKNVANLRFKYNALCITYDDHA